MTAGIITFADGTTLTQELDKWSFLPDILKRSFVSETFIDSHFDDLIKLQMFEDFKQVMPTGEVKQIKSIELLSNAPYPKTINVAEDLQVIRAKDEIRKEELLERQRQRERNLPYLMFGLLNPILLIWWMMS